jgi:NADH-quinone oxidoreductase subunit L
MAAMDFVLQPGPITSPSSALLPIVLAPLLGALINGLGGAHLQARFGPRAVHAVALGAMILSSLAALVAVTRLAALPAGARYLLDRRFTMLAIPPLEVDFALALDPLAAVMVLVVTLCGTLIHLYAAGYMKQDQAGWRFFAYFNLFVAAMLLLVLADSLLLCFFGWEGVGLCSYLLIGFWYRDRDNVRAADKAFLVNRVGDLGFLLAMLLLVGAGSGAFAPAPDRAPPAPGAAAAETTSPLLTFRELRAELTGSAPAGAAPTLAGAPASAVGRAQLFGVPVILLVGLALFLAMAGKSAQLPLHVWLPDAMAGPTPVSALIHAATMVTAGVYLAARLSFLLVHSPEAMAVIAAAGVVTAFLGAAMAVVQQDIKKVLAYSTISQLGFMFLAVGVGAFGPALFHLVTHAAFKACLFLAAGSVIHALHERMEHASPGLVPADRRQDADPADPQDLRNMGGLARSLPHTRVAYLLGAVAIAGFPLASGFYSKDEILWRAFTSGTLVAGGLLYTLAVLSAGLTAFYVFRSYYLAFRGRVGPDAAPGAQPLREPPRSMMVPLYLLAGASLLLGPILGWPHAWGGNPLLEGFLRPLFLEAETFGRNRPMPVWTPFLLQALGLAITGAGWLLARRLYRDLARGQARRGQLRRRLDRLHRWLWNGLRIDELYRALLVLPAEDFARAAWFTDRRLVDGAVSALSRGARALSRLGGAIDAKVVDGVVNGVSELTLAGGRRLARLQTGRINHYVLGIALGAGALVAITWVIK